MRPVWLYFNPLFVVVHDEQHGICPSPALSQSLERLLQALPPHPIDEQSLNVLVSSVISESNTQFVFRQPEESMGVLAQRRRCLDLQSPKEGPLPYFNALWDRASMSF